MIGQCRVLFLSRICQRRLEILTAIEDAEDRHRLGTNIDGEGDHGTVSVVRRAQTRHDVIACGAA